MTADVVIVGAGSAGCAMAYRLGMAGLKVTVLERRHVVGGAAVTEEFHPGFRNSVASYTVSLLQPKVIRDMRLEEHGYAGILQVASFHPQFQFADTAPADMGNATNRSPYPTLHILREASIDRAVAAFPDPEAIFEANIETLEALGADGWAALQAQCREDAQDS